jgi:hypothetical protein
LSALARPRKLASAGRPEETARALAAKHGPPDERPALRKDISTLRQAQLGEVMWIVKNPATSKYFQFREPMWQIISLFDGTRRSWTRSTVTAPTKWEWSWSSSTKSSSAAAS